MPSDGKSSHCLWQGELKKSIQAFHPYSKYCIKNMMHSLKYHNNAISMHTMFYKELIKNEGRNAVTSFCNI